MYGLWALKSTPKQGVEAGLHPGEVKVLISLPCRAKRVTDTAMGFSSYRPSGSLWASWYSWSTELCSHCPSKPVCSSVALLTSKTELPDGRPSAHAGYCATPAAISHLPWPGNGEVLWELAPACNKWNSNQSKDYTSLKWVLLQWCFPMEVFGRLAQATPLTSAASSCVCRRTSLLPGKKLAPKLFSEQHKALSFALLFALSPTHFHLFSKCCFFPWSHRFLKCDFTSKPTKCYIRLWFGLFQLHASATDTKMDHASDFR